MSLQEIIDWDLAVPMSKLVKITGYSRMELKQIDPPMVCKKIRPSDFWKWVAKLQKQYRPVAASSTGRNGGQLQVEDKSNEPDGWNAQRAASRLLGQSPAHSNG